MHCPRQVLDPHRQVIGGRLGLRGVEHLVRAHRGGQRPGHADAVDAAADPVRAVDVVRMVAGRGLPAGAGKGGDIVQAAGPEHVPRPPVGPVPAPSLLVVVPLALVNQIGEPVDARIGIGGLVKSSPMPSRNEKAAPATNAPHAAISAQK